MDAGYFEQLWRKEAETDPGRKGYCREGRSASWDSMVEKFDSDIPDERIDKIVNLLLEKKLLQKTSSVLDIGCGPGKFAIEFAKRSKSVSGLDISPKMLRKAEQNVAALGLDNIEFKEMDWEKADLMALKWRKKYSLVTAIMSPALNGRESLEKMMEASREYCFLSHYVERYDTISNELKEGISGRKVNDEYGNIALYCSMNILWLNKLFPEVVYFNADREITRPLEEAIRYYIGKLEQKSALTAVQKTEIMDFLRKKEKDGVIKEKISAKIACIYWKNN